jgi:transposase InsO family protein
MRRAKRLYTGTIKAANVFKNPRTGLWLGPRKYPRNTFKLLNVVPTVQIHKNVRGDTGLHITGESGTYVSDLMFLDNYARKNSGYKILLVVIDIISRQVYVRKMKKKSETLHELQDICKDLKPPMKILYTDSGSEYTNTAVKKWADNRGIELRPGKSSNTIYIVERVNRTLRDLIERYITTHDFRWIDAIDDIVYNYNHSPHRALMIAGKLKAPADINETDRQILRARDISNNKSIIDELREKYHVGAKVRIRVPKSVFAKGGTGNFSEQVYTVKEYLPPARIRVEAGGSSKIVPVRNALLVRVVGAVSGKQGVARERNRLQRSRMTELSNVREGIDIKNIISGDRPRLT